MIDSNETQIIHDDEIDLIVVGKTIWSGRKLISIITVIFFAIGFIIAFGSRVEYEATCILLPENQEDTKSNMGGLSGLAGLAGINLNVGNSGVLTPELYPEIAKSLPFQLQILNDSLFIESKNAKTTLYNYIKEIDRRSFFGFIYRYTIGLPKLINSSNSNYDISDTFKHINDEPIKISKADWRLIKKFKDRIKISIDEISGLVNVSVEMPDPDAAAHITNKVVKLLTQKVVEYKVTKAKVNLDFVQSSFDEATRNFELAQLALARNSDRNRNVTSAIAEIEIQRLQNEHSVAFEVYKGLASQVEQAKIKLKEETPIFTILEPVKLPVEKSKPKRVLILIASIVIGFLLGVFTVFVSKAVQK